MSYQLLEGAGAPVKAWTSGVPFEPEARRQVRNIAALPFIHRWVAVMPDVHFGLGATIGSVIPTRGAIVPAAVGVDIGCGMMAARTSLNASDLPDSPTALRAAIEAAVPHGRTAGGKRSADRGAWGEPPARVENAWRELSRDFERIAARHPAVAKSNHRTHLGTLGTGNHFIEVCLDQDERVWFLLHSGSRGVGNRVGRYFIELAKKDMRESLGDLPDADLAYFREGARHFDDYVQAVDWAQRYARVNRELMMSAVVSAARSLDAIPPFRAEELVVDCHHNYVERERHYGAECFVTRKGAVRARSGELGIVPGSMGARSYIVRGLGNPESFESCSHGAGRAMSRREAKRRFSLEDHARATRGVECRKDAGVIDETPGAYKSIDAVMQAQRDLVEIVHRLSQIVCVKG